MEEAGAAVRAPGIHHAAHWPPCSARPGLPLFWGVCPLELLPGLTFLPGLEDFPRCACVTLKTSRVPNEAKGKQAQPRPVSPSYCPASVGHLQHNVPGASDPWEGPGSLLLWALAEDKWSPVALSWTPSVRHRFLFGGCFPWSFAKHGFPGGGANQFVNNCHKMSQRRGGRRI